MKDMTPEEVIESLRNEYRCPNWWIEAVRLTGSICAPPDLGDFSGDRGILFEETIAIVIDDLTGDARRLAEYEHELICCIGILEGDEVVRHIKRKDLPVDQAQAHGKRLRDVRHAAINIIKNPPRRPDGLAPGETTLHWETELQKAITACDISG